MKNIILLLAPLLFGCQKAELLKPTYTVSFELTDKYPDIEKRVIMICGEDTVKRYLSDRFIQTFTIEKDTYVSCYITADTLFHSQITVRLNSKKVFHKEGTCPHEFYGFENYLVNI